MFFPCFWVCLINHFFIVSFNVFQCVSLFSWIFTVCFNMFIVFPCFSNVLGCVILQNEFKLKWTSKYPRTQLETAWHRAQFSLDGSTDVSIFSEIYSNWPHMFFLSFSVKPLNSFKINSKADLCTNPDLQSATTSMETRNSLTWTSNEPQMGLNQDQPVNDF